jgi:uncharacterized membrane protein
METVRTLSLIAATLTLGLMAGLFAAYSYSVMPGLARSQDTTLVEAMQRINVAIGNVWFASCFIGALVFSVLATILHAGRGAIFWWLLAAAILYVVQLAVTIRFNIPLNNELAAATDPVTARANFEAAWVRWNLVRTAVSGLAFTSAIVALIVR